MISVKHSGVICAGFIAVLALAALLWQHHRNWRSFLRKAGALVWYLQQQFPSCGAHMDFAIASRDQAEYRTLQWSSFAKIGDIHSPLWLKECISYRSKPPATIVVEQFEFLGS